MNSAIGQHHPVSIEQTIAWLSELVGRALEIPTSQLDQDTHLASYGLDSVATVALMTAISDRTSLEFDETLLLDYPTISQLARHIVWRTGASGDIALVNRGSTDFHSLLREDSILPDDIQPPRNDSAAKPAAILLTGASGFLGVHLLDVLARNTSTRIYCLVRTLNDVDAADRLASALYDNQISISNFTDRVTVIDGDISEPQLGLSTNTFADLVDTIDSIYHCAANVNWGLDYYSLRNVNVLPVVELLRMCCLGKKKDFVFVSSISVCYAYQGPEIVAENTPALSLTAGIHLGYAQSKAVAETLCEQARARGLQVIIHRPGLILGNSITGHANNDDLVSRVIKGCIAMRCAPDLEWLVDACPVNDVANAIYSLSEKNKALLSTTHLVHPQPRYWRELVLWMNIYGYPVELIPYSQWADLLAAEAISTEHPLYPLRSFFLRRLSEAGDLTLPEIYEEHRHSKIESINTLSELSTKSLQYAPLDSDLFDRYFKVFREKGFLPATPGKIDQAPRAIDTVLNNRFFRELAEEVFRDPDSQITAWQKKETSIVDSIITDLASWKFGRPSGLFRYSLANSSAKEHDVFIKVKPEDRAVLDVAAVVGDLCSQGLGDLIQKFKRQTGLAGCHERELAIYRQPDPGFRLHVPRPLMIVDDAREQKWIIAMECITDPLFIDTSARAPRWPSEHIISCIDGLAKIHSIWLRREDELANQGRLCNVLTSDDMREATPLWLSIGRHADGFFETALGETVASMRNQIIDSVHEWWLEMESLDRTLIHNDFNPRNLAIVSRQGRPTLCAFDWELAALGLPQRDLAEFLCFALPHDHVKSEADRYIEQHREKLEQISGISLDKEAWLHGFKLALFDLAINRIPMYTLIHRIRPQNFLLRVTQTWYALIKEYCDIKNL